MEYQVQAPNGELHVIDGPEGASDQEVLEQAQKLFPGPSMGESFARGVENNFPLANQAIAASSSILGNKDYSQNLAEQNAAIQQAKAANPKTYGAGAVTGVVAPAFIPGVGEAMSAAPIASGAALGAANAVGGTDIAQQPEEALKQAAIGAGTGAALGAVLPTGATASQDLEQIANAKAVQGLGLKPGLLGIPKEELEDLGQFAHEAGLTQGPLEQRVGQAKDLLGQVGAQIGEVGVGAQPLSNPEPFIDQLHSHLQESASVFGPEANIEVPVYRQAIANLSQPGMTFDTLQQLKTAVGQRAFDATGSVRNDAAANVYNVYKDAMKSIIDSSPSEYQEAMTTYGKLKDITSALTNQWQKEQASGIQAKGFGMVGKMAGMVGGGHPAVNIGTAAALAPSHPFMALGALTPLITNPTAMETAARGAASAVPVAAAAVKMGSIDSVTYYLMNTLSSNPQKLGRFAQPLLQAAQTGGTQGIAAQHYILSSNYPEYNQMMLNPDKQDSANEP